MQKSLTKKKSNLALDVETPPIDLQIAKELYEAFCKDPLNASIATLCEQNERFPDPFVVYGWMEDNPSFKVSMNRLYRIQKRALKEYGLELTLKKEPTLESVIAKWPDEEFSSQLKIWGTLISIWKKKIAGVHTHLKAEASSLSFTLPHEEGKSQGPLGFQVAVTSYRELEEDHTAPGGRIVDQENS